MLKSESACAEGNLKISVNEINRLANEYDHSNSWWIEREKEIGQRINEEKEFGMEILKEIVEWKFYTLPGRIKRTLNLLRSVSDLEIRKHTRSALSLGTDFDDARIKFLRNIRGVGISLSSVILTFHDPVNYCVYDIHVMREMYGREPKTIFTVNRHYLRLLRDLRCLSIKYSLNVRTIEKALFLRNIQSS